MAKQPHKSEPDLALDLKSLGFDDDGDTPEPDTSVTMQIIVDDQKTPGSAKSFLAILGYMRKTNKRTEKRIDTLERKIERYIAWALGASAAMFAAWELFKQLAHK